MLDKTGEAGGLADATSSPKSTSSVGREVVAERRWQDRTYRQVRVRCGKDRCKKCGPGGEGHGPYWYAYWREGGKVRCAYVGKETPWGKFNRGEIDWEGRPVADEAG